MGCNCKKKGETVARQYYVPATDTEPSKIIETNEIIPVPQTPDEQHTQDMTEYVKTLENNFDDWYNNIDEITPLNDGKTRET